MFWSGVLPFRFGSHRAFLRQSGLWMIFDLWQGHLERLTKMKPSGNYPLLPYQISAPYIRQSTTKCIDGHTDKQTVSRQTNVVFFFIFILLLFVCFCFVVFVFVCFCFVFVFVFYVCFVLFCFVFISIKIHRDYYKFGVTLVGVFLTEIVVYPNTGLSYRAFSQGGENV